MISYKSMFFISILVIYCLPVSRGFLPTRFAYRLNSLDFSQRESRQLSLETNQEPKPGESYTLNKDIVNNLEASPTQSLQILRLRYELFRVPLSSQEIQIIQSLLSQYLLSIQLITLPANTATVNLFQHFNRVKQILPKLLYSLGNLKSISPSWYLQKERDMIMQILSTYYSSNIKGFKSNNNSNNLSKSQISSSSNVLSPTSNIDNKNELLYFDGLALSDIFIGLCRLKISPYFLLNKSSFIDNIQHELQRLLNPFPASSTSSTSTSETSESSTTPHYVLVGDLLWYFGSFSIKWSSLPQSLQSILLLSYQSGVSNFASSSLASSIWAFAKMGIQWRQFSDQLQNLILNKISQSMSKFTSQQAMKVLWSLSTLGVRFSQTSMSMIESLLSKVLLTGYTPKIPPSNSNTAITTSSDIVDATVTTASPTAPSATEDVTEGKESDAKIIPSTAELLLQQDSASSISQGLMALAKMKIRWNDILQYSNRKYYPTLLSSNQNNNPTHAASVVDPPSSMVSIENMDLVNKMLDRFQYICLSYNSVAISNSIWALGTMGLKLGQVSSTSSTSPSIYSPNGGNIADYYNAATVVTDVRDVTKTMLQTILRILPECNAWTFTNILSGLSLMKFSWFDLPSSLQETMIATILRLRYQMNTIDICTILYALAELDCTIDGLPSYFIDNILAPILRNLSSMNGNELSNIISSMSALGISWNMLPAEIQWSINSGIRREYMNMTAHALGNTVYGITMMCFDAEDTSDVSFRGVHETLLDAVIEKIKGINLAASDLPLATKTTVNSRNDVIEEEDLFNYRIYCHYIHIMQYITNPRRIPLSLLNYQLNRNQMKERQHRHSYKPDISPMQWEIEEEEKEKQEQEETLKKSNKDDRTKLREEELVKVFGFVTPIRYTEREKHERAIIQYYQKSSIVITTNTSKISNLQEEIYDHLLQAIDTLSANQILPSSMTSSQSSYSPSSSYYIEEEMSNSGSTSLEDSFLANKKIVVSKEVSYFDGLFPLDLVIRLEDLPSNATIIPLTSLLLAVIEVNGPSHYTKSYQQKLKRKDKYKEIIYKRLFSYINEMNNYYPIQYMHMKYNEIQYIGARQLCNELMITLIEKVIQYYQSLYFIPSYYYYKYPSLYNLKNYLWKLQQQLNEFFNWGLKK